LNKYISVAYKVMSSRMRSYKPSKPANNVRTLKKTG